MNRKTISPYRWLDSYLPKGLPVLTFWTLLILCSDEAFAQTAGGTTDTSPRLRVTHLIGFEAPARMPTEVFRDGRVILERRVNGNVRFLGSNLRVTHNLARNVAKTIDQSSLPEPSTSAPVGSGQPEDETTITKQMEDRYGKTDH